MCLYLFAGELYMSINEGVKFLSSKFGDQNLFCGCLDLQITEQDVKLDGLVQIKNLETAVSALQTIIEQGEGATKAEGSHFERFNQIAKEYDQLLLENPDFEPARRLAKNPVMRKHDAGNGRTYIDHPLAARYLDLGNALYTLMLKFLMQVYSMEHRSREGKAQILGAAFSLMHLFADVAQMLTELPATVTDPETRASLNFAINRSANPLELKSEKKLLIERLEEISLTMNSIFEEDSSLSRRVKLEGIKERVQKQIRHLSGSSLT